MDKKIVEIAARAMKVTMEEAMNNCEKIPDINAYYFWQPTRGGVAIIVSENGEKLGATSSVSYERHLEAFKSGKRN